MKLEEKDLKHFVKKIIAKINDDDYLDEGIMEQIDAEYEAKVKAAYALLNRTFDSYIAEVKQKYGTDYVEYIEDIIDISDYDYID